MKLVLDTNVLIAALISRGVCADLLEHCVLRHEVVSSDFILNELRGHLVGKFKYDAAEADEVVGLFVAEMEIVTPKPLPLSVCRDADDDFILATAVAGQAECIVTGDKDLLVLRQYEGIKIVSPSEFTDFEANADSEEKQQE
jgi:putative PIN family toxin of toxin-antitoxin system